MGYPLQGVLAWIEQRSAAVLAFALLKELGLPMGNLAFADMRSVLARLELQVAAPERLERERDDAAHRDYIEAIHAARAGVHQHAANANADEDDLPW